MGWALSPLLLDEAGWLRDLARHHTTRSTCCTCRLAWLQNPCVFHWTHGVKENNDHHLQFIHWKSPDFTDPDRNHDKGVRRKRDGRWGELEQFPRERWVTRKGHQTSLAFLPTHAPLPIKTQGQFSLLLVCPVTYEAFLLSLFGCSLYANKQGLNFWITESDR